MGKERLEFFISEGGFHKKWALILGVFNIIGGGSDSFFDVREKKTQIIDQ